MWRALMPLILIASVGCGPSRKSDRGRAVAGVQSGTGGGVGSGTGIVIGGVGTGIGTGTAQPTLGPGVSGTGPGPAPGPGADQHGDTAGAATAITVGVPVTGAVQAGGDQDYFKVPLTGGKTYEFRTDTTGDTALTLLRPDGTSVLDFNDDEDTAAGKRNSKIVGFVAPTTETYHLLVEGMGTSTPTYTVSAIER